MLSFGVAKELGMTVQQLHANITAEELMGWSAYFGIVNRRQDAAMKKAQSGDKFICWLMSVAAYNGIRVGITGKTQLSADGSWAGSIRI